MADEKEVIASFDCITVIVQRGEANKVVKAAISAGAQGATVFFGRGSGVRERIKLLGITINPEKEIILIVTQRNITDKVFTAVVEAGKLKEPGQGFAYIQEVTRCIGFIE